LAVLLPSNNAQCPGGGQKSNRLPKVKFKNLAIDPRAIAIKFRAVGLFTQSPWGEGRDEGESLE
jgi:hypothetical protein